jgi:hypothetical protein
MISAVVAKGRDHQEGFNSYSDVDDSFTCRTDQTTVRVSNVRLVTVSGSEAILPRHQCRTQSYCKNTFLIHLYPSLFH